MFFDYQLLREQYAQDKKISDIQTSNTSDSMGAF
jgi:hypothetical protein